MVTTRPCRPRPGRCRQRPATGQLASKMPTPARAATRPLTTTFRSRPSGPSASDPDRERQHRRDRGRPQDRARRWRHPGPGRRGAGRGTAAGNRRPDDVAPKSSRIRAKDTKVTAWADQVDGRRWRQRSVSSIAVTTKFDWTDRSTGRTVMSSFIIEGDRAPPSRGRISWGDGRATSSALEDVGAGTGSTAHGPRRPVARSPGEWTGDGPASAPERGSRSPSPGRRVIRPTRPLWRPCVPTPPSHSPGRRVTRPTGGADARRGSGATESGSPAGKQRPGMSAALGH